MLATGAHLFENIPQNSKGDQTTLGHSWPLESEHSLCDFWGDSEIKMHARIVIPSNNLCPSLHIFRISQSDNQLACEFCEEFGQITSFR